MPGDRLYLEQEDMLDQADTIKSAIDTYQGIAKDPFGAELGYLDAMNTDFTAKLKTMLDDLNDSNPKLLESLEEIAELTESISKTLKKVDTDGAGSMGMKAEAR